MGTNDHTYGYTGVNPLVQSLTRPNQSVTSYGYDNLNRLLDLQTRDSETTLINRFQYTYNQQDLRERETVTNGLPLPTQQQALTTYESNNVNQLTSTASPAQTFTYDNDGNLTQGYTPGGIVYTAAYDAEDRLKSVEFTGPDAKVYKTEYTYRWDGMLAIEKKYENAVLVTTTNFVMDGMLPIQERDATNAVTREYTWGLNLGGGIGGLLQMKQQGSTYSYLYDGKGNVSALIDSTQQVVAKYRYDAYGNLQAEVGTVSQPYLFSTKRYDYQLGTYYYGYRFYSPSTGRWLTRDPLGEYGGLNLYGFVGNDPINSVDPSGEIAVETVIVIIAVAVIATGASIAIRNLIREDKRRDAALDCLVEAINTNGLAGKIPDDTARRGVCSGTNIGVAGLELGEVLPGTTVSGPVPTSTVDLVVGTGVDLTKRRLKPTLSK